MKNLGCFMVLIPLVSACAVLTTAELAPNADMKEQTVSFNKENKMMKSMMAHPQNAADLLNNLEWVVETGALLKSEFYQPDQLKQCFNYQSIDKSTLGSSTSYQLSGLSNILTKNPLHPMEPEIELVVPQVLSSGYLYMRTEGDSRIDADVIQKLWGTPNQVVDAVAASRTDTPVTAANGSSISPPPLLSRGTVTHPLGSKDLMWRFVHGGVITEIVAKIWGDGVVSELTLTQKGA
jgi:hypothetical protein